MSSVGPFEVGRQLLKLSALKLAELRVSTHLCISPLFVPGILLYKGLVFLKQGLSNFCSEHVVDATAYQH